MNWPIQSTGADLMRIVCIAATEVGIEVAAPVHDAFLIVSPLERLDQDVAHMREIMIRASKVVTGGLPIRVDQKVVRFPDRYMTRVVSRCGIESWGCCNGDRRGQRLRGRREVLLEWSENPQWVGGESGGLGAFL
jgi:hypothetical protein